jgi:hypothetical protein
MAETRDILESKTVKLRSQIAEEKQLMELDPYEKRSKL